MPPTPTVRACATAALVLACAGGAAAADAGIDPALQAQVQALVQPLVQPLDALPAALRPHARVQIDIGRLDPRLRLAPCRRVEPRWPARSRAWGRTQLALRCIDGDKPWQVYLPLTVKVFAPALVPVRTLAAGTVLAAADLTVGAVDWAASPTPPLTHADAAVGRTLARSLQAGQAFGRDHLRLKQYFAGGDPVQVTARGSGFAVAGEGQALGPGLEGQTVRVRTGSGRILVGTAVGHRRVEVLL